MKKLVLVILLTGISINTYASNNDHYKNHPSPQYQSQKAYGGNAKSKAIAGAAAVSGAKSGVVFNNEETHPDDIRIRQLGTLVNHPSNNTSTCIKVWGLATGNKDVQGILGIPDRDEQCDLDRAAQDAFQQGSYLLGWNFKCSMKSINHNFMTTYQVQGKDIVVTKNTTPQARHAACMNQARKFAPIKDE